MSKKKIPFFMLELLSRSKNNNLDLIMAVQDQSIIVKFVDIDPQSTFHYTLIEEKINNAALSYTVQYRPGPNEELATITRYYNKEGVVKSFMDWLTVVKKYNEIETIFDDPILKAYEKEFVEQIKIVDEDAETAPFNLKKQIYLVEYLTAVDDKLEKLKANKDPEEIEEIQKLQIEASTIKSQISKLTKAQVIKRLSTFWAKARKTGFDIIKEIFINVASEVTTKLISGGT